MPPTAETISRTMTMTRNESVEDASIESAKTRMEAAWARAEEARLEFNEAYSEWWRIERDNQLTKPIVYDVFLPPEFDWLSESLRFEHEALQREARDHSWATAAEDQLQQYFSDRPEILSKYGRPTIVCGSTRCQVTLVAYGIEEETSSVYHDVILELQERPELTHNVESSVWGTNSANRITTLYWAFDRK